MFYIRQNGVTRSELIDFVKTMMRRHINERATFSVHTIDSYRNYLYQAGYIEKTGRGMYRLIKDIPIDLSLEDVKNEAYGKNDSIKEYRFWRNQSYKIKKIKSFIKEEEFKV